MLAICVCPRRTAHASGVAHGSAAAGSSARREISAGAEQQRSAFG